MLYLILAGAAVLYIAGITAVISIIALLIYEKISNIPMILTKVDNMANLLTELNAIAQGDSAPRYKSADGRYAADSMEELISKMANDPESSLTDDDVEALKKIFEQIIDEEEDDD